ncbi:MAG: hypothetical protein WCI88_16840 [Chloroflexota bacterium]
MKNLNDLLNQWQDGIEKIQSNIEDTPKDEELEQLYEVAGMHIHSGVVAGQLFSLLTICRCED